MNNRKKLIGFYDYTVILTYLGMLFGVTGVSFVMKNNFFSAVVCLMTAGVCDMFDGTVANTKQRTSSEKKFGIQIDSLSDLICFGILPGLFVYKICNESIAAFIISAAYILCALIRLAYFNVCEEERQDTESGARKFYTGLPVTSAALVVPALYALLDNKYSYMAFLVLMGVLFISPIKITKPKVIGKTIIAAMGLMEVSVLVMGVFDGV